MQAQKPHLVPEETINTFHKKAVCIPILQAHIHENGALPSLCKTQHRGEREGKKSAETLVLKIEMKIEAAKERWQTFHRILQQFQQQMKA